MAESSNRFKKGMNQDLHPAEQLEQTYRSALNFVLLSQEGNIYTITNENGTSLIDEVTFPAGFQIAGYTVLNTDIIVVLSDGTNSQIGYIREDSNNLDPDYGYYRPVAPFDPAFDSATDPRDAYPENNSEFGFTLTHPVDCQARKLINGNRVLYYTDNLNPFGRVELENPPEVGSVAEQSNLVFNQTIPRIDFVEMRENVQGSLRPGVYQFITRYVTDNGGVTSFGIPTDQISVVPPDKDVRVEQYEGEFYDNVTVNKNIVLELTNVDQNYQEIEIIVAYYDQGTTFTARSVGNLPITGDTINFTFTGPETGEEIAITREELRQVPISYKRAKCIEQKDNTLFLSNLSDDATPDEVLQAVANNITVEYAIEEVPYSGREGNSISVDSGGIFTATTIELGEVNTVLVTFDRPVSLDGFSAAANNSLVGSAITYGGLDNTLEKNGEPSLALVDNTATALTDTVEIDGITFTAVASIVDPTIEFEIGATVADTSTNLANAVNAATGRNFAALPFDDGGVIKTRMVWVDGTGNGETLTYVGTITGDATFTGGTTTVSVLNATNMTQPADNQIEIEFSGANQISESDILSLFEIFQDPIINEPASVNGNVDIGATDGADSLVGGADESGYTDYLDEKVIFDNRCYRRGEVYSLGFMLLFKDGTTSFVYHIPGNDKVTTTLGKAYPDLGGSTYRTGATSGELGTYLSTNEYPLDQNYPGNVDGDDQSVATVRNIRHHVMPTLEQEPHFRDTGNSGAFIRTLGLKFTIDPANDIPADLIPEIQEIVFVRERRNLDINKSVLSQGIINRLVETADHCNNDGSISGTVVDNVRRGYCLQEMPFFNNLELALVSGDSRQKSSGHSFRGVAYPGLSGSEATFGGGTFANGRKLNTEIRGNRAFFHSPESILAADTGVTTDELGGTIMRPWLLMEGAATTTVRAKCLYKGEAGDDWCEGYGFQDMHGNYVSYDTSFSYSTLAGVDATNPDRTIGSAASRAAGVKRNPAISPDQDRPNRSTTRWTQGGWEVFVTNENNGVTAYDPAASPFSNNSDHFFINQGGTKFYLNHEVESWDKATVCLNDCKNSSEKGEVRVVGSGAELPSATTVAIKNHLYNIEVNNEVQYGQLSAGSFIPIGRFSLQTAGSEYGTVFSGDTFITKFAVNTGGLFWYYPYNRFKDSSINKPQGEKKSTSSRRGYRHVDGAGDESNDTNKAEGYDFRACHYFFVESDINTYYRHRPTEEEQQSFFPDQPDPKVNLENFFAWAGNIRAYNGLYSFENNLREFFVKGSTQQVVTDFENRTIYSEQAQTDSVVDAYRSFLVNNYYDLPAHTGPIWDTFVHANTLFMHTPKSCWRTFAEPAATLSGGNIADVVLGTGSLFARPSTEVLTTDGGYAGSISQYGGTHTQMGYIFPDVLQGKVFLLGAGQGGPILKDLSLEGLYTFFHGLMDLGITRDPITGVINLANITTSNAFLVDNPYQGIGFLGGYDYKLRRAWIQKQGDFGFNVSYSALMQSWSSFHSYRPSVIIPFDNRVFFFRNGNQTDAWEMNIGAKARYFDVTYNSELELSVPTGIATSFTNQLFYADITDTNGRLVRDDFFDSYQVTSDKYNTGLLAFVAGNTFNPTKTDGEVFHKFRNDAYQVAVPRDAVVDNSGDILDPNNIYQPQGGNAPIDGAYPIRERIKGDYAVFKYTYDNTDGNSFVLREIRTIFEKNIR